MTRLAIWHDLYIIPECNNTPFAQKTSYTLIAFMYDQSNSKSPRNPS